jgi:Na+/H+ antiporter NhaD/arsenite permease-like protein
MALFVAFVFSINGHALEAAPHIHSLDGAALHLGWALPFGGILLSLAFLPLLAPDFWHHHFGKVAAFWCVAFIAPCLYSYGISLTFSVTLHTLFLEYIPFVILLAALFTITNGIRIESRWQGTPISNMMVLGIGGFLASFIGTTGASMLLIHPLIRANRWRHHKAHIIIFFIFLVSNIGGALTPLGDPPLFLGFLNGVPFFWTLKHLWFPMLIVIIPLLALFYGIDRWYFAKENHYHKIKEAKTSIKGSFNFVFLLGVLGAVLLSGSWDPQVEITLFHIPLKLQNIIRDLMILGLTFLSFMTSDPKNREANEFSWAPLLEILKIFFSIFITVSPVISMLSSGLEGPFASLVSLATCDGKPDNAIYFWLSGILSSFLDNAPTYLVFFYMASGDPLLLTGECYKTLVAISAGSVFMGALTYIGNAPNFMVKSIAQHKGIKMPGFFGYMAWSWPILGGLFALLTLVYFL